MRAPPPPKFLHGVAMASPNVASEVPLAGKLKFASDVTEILEEGFSGADLALDSCEWCRALGHPTETIRETYIALEQWAQHAFPELEIQLNEDVRARDTGACCWHLSVRVRV